MSPEERLLLSVADAPELSAGLRARVLTASVESQRRRSYGRRAVWAAGLFILCAGLTAWRAPLQGLGREVAGQNGLVRRSTIAGPEVAAIPPEASGSSYDPSAPLLNVSARYGRGELLLSAAGDDWRLVEAEMHSRREGVRHLRLSF
ncbi:MAG TPA: hypothetical protein VL475_08805 [Planctomycetaceae bacterium]|nr:hypothetical protein [Planctomycetaceae bacterium]